MSMPPHLLLDELDQRLLAALQLNGRASWQVVAKVVGASESTVQRRFTALRRRGAARVVGVVDVLRCGLGVPVLVRVSCRSAAAHEVATRLAARPEARFVTMVTGSVDAVAELVVPTHQEIAQVLIHELPAADQVTDTETLAVMRTFTSVHDWGTDLLEPAAVAMLRPEPCSRSRTRSGNSHPTGSTRSSSPSPRRSVPTDVCRYATSPPRSAPARRPSPAGSTRWWLAAACGSPLWWSRRCSASPSS